MSCLIFFLRELNAFDADLNTTQSDGLPHSGNESGLSVLKQSLKTSIGACSTDKFLDN
jgi:hypothetical protein